MAIETYKNFKKEAEENLSKQKKHSNKYSILRFLVVLTFIVSLYYFLFDFNKALGLVLVACFFAFIYLISKHQKVKSYISALKESINLNSKEIEFLENNYYPFADGIEFLDREHPYSKDLDLLGDHGMLQYINRCQSYQGLYQLAHRLLKPAKQKQIIQNQNIVEDLKDRTEFRNQFFLHTGLADLYKDKSEKLQEWSNHSAKEIPKWISKLSYGVFILMWLLILFFLIKPLPGAIATCFKYGSLSLLVLLASQLKLIRKNSESNEKWEDSIQEINQILYILKTTKFSVTPLRKLSQEAKRDSIALSKIARIFGQLQSIENPLGALLINALMPFHIYYYNEYCKWQNMHKGLIARYLKEIGKMEFLLSLSQYAYNNPELSKPKITDTEELVIENGIHPLMKHDEAVANSIDFSKKEIYILTGSNMSGKSTFLRTIGLIRVLALAGSFVPASRAEVCISSLMCFMRVEDSISRGASFFKAELDRLSEIVETSKKKRTFVLLDEVLKGTNSEDKRKGTIGLLEKLLGLGTQGVLATHDLEVCKLSDIHPSKMANICFESEVIDGKLTFDYKVRDGICHNTNASFLLKQEGII